MVNANRTNKIKSKTFIRVVTDILKRVRKRAEIVAKPLKNIRFIGKSTHR